MVPYNTERSLFAALVPPGPAHINAVRSLQMPREVDTALVAGFWAALPLDYFLRITGKAHLKLAEVRAMPAGSESHPLAGAALLRALRLNCLTNAYADLWGRLFHRGWATESWVADWPGLDPLGRGADGPLTVEWTPGTPLRTERARRAALVELDALVSVWLGISDEELVAIYRSRYPQLVRYEELTWFDANGRKIAEHRSAFGWGQTRDHYEQLTAHLEDPDRVPPPERYAPPFYKADREAEYRQAHGAFSKRLRAAVDSGWELQ
jgi:hypothetical protein